jgi:hypothetical protein
MANMTDPPTVRRVVKSIQSQIVISQYTTTPGGRQAIFGRAKPSRGAANGEILGELLTLPGSKSMIAWMRNVSAEN